MSSDEVLGKWKLTELLAVSWSEDMAARFPNATHVMCRQEMQAGEDGMAHSFDPVRCMGWHCNRCGKATNSYGHQYCGHLSAAPIEDSPPNPLHCDQCPPWKCEDCGDMCTAKDLCRCWAPLDGMALADIKALFAASDLSIGRLGNDQRGDL